MVWCNWLVKQVNMVKITQNTQIGNVSVEQMAMSMGSDPDHLVEALEEVFGS